MELRFSQLKQLITSKNGFQKFIVIISVMCFIFTPDKLTTNNINKFFHYHLLLWWWCLW